MSRQRTSEPYVQQKISIPAHLMGRFARHHWDPVLQKIRYGAVSEVVTKLLTEYLNKLEGDPQPNSEKEPT